MLKLLTNLSSTLLLLTAIIFGSLIGGIFPDHGEALSSSVDPLILVLVSLSRKHLRFLSLAWMANFIVIPLIGWGIAALFLSGQPLLFTGLLIYFIAPCTDWFLGFTRLARGNVALGSVLLPVNLISQLLLFPVFLGLFAGKSIGADILSIGSTLSHWFLVPFFAAVGLHEGLKRILPSAVFTKILSFANTLVPIVIAMLVLCIFSGNIITILGDLSAFLVILVAVFAFFLATYFLGEFISRRFQLNYPEQALLVMTTAARNAPLMLGLTTAVFPDQPLIYAAIIIGMLVEFPHLTALKHLLLRQQTSATSPEYLPDEGSLTESPVSLPHYEHR